MSRSAMKCFLACLLVLTCSLFSQGKNAAPKATVAAPVNGPQAGTVVVAGSWKGCTAIDRVVINVWYKNAQGVPQPVAKSSQLVAPPALLPTGNWSPTISGLPSGGTVTTVEIVILPAPPPGGGMIVPIASAQMINLNFPIP